MRKEELGILSLLAGILISWSAAVTSEPLVPFLINGVEEFAHTFVVMAWVTWWALVLGFSIAGGVEAWLEREMISDALSGVGLRELVTASFFGFISSSCSYSAIATAKNLFKKGSSAGASLGAFMFSATNLVIEIGLVIWILLGWQFVVANYIGGIILILLMAFILEFIVPDEIVAEARKTVRTETDKVVDPVCGMEFKPTEADATLEHGGTTHYFCSKSCKESFSPEDEPQTVWENLTSKAGWQKLADKQWSEWSMLWDDILVGFAFASVIAAFVPNSLWTAVFATDILGPVSVVVWATIIGAIIGVITFVCSVGNVPFAAILWASGMPFGGILSYIYADLIVPPIVDAYREYYGWNFAKVLTITIFVSGVVAGILTHGIFAVAGLIPPRATATIAEFSIEMDYKAALNALATIVFIVLFYLRSSTDGHQHGEEHSHE